MADDGKVYICPREQNLDIDNLKCCTGEELDKPDCQGNISFVKFIGMIGHKFNRSYAILENVTNIKMHRQGHDEFRQKQIKLVKTFDCFKVRVGFSELLEKAPNEAGLKNENKDASIE